MGRTSAIEAKSYAQRQHRSSVTRMVTGNHRRGDISGVDRTVCRNRDTQSLGERRPQGGARGQATFRIAQESAPDPGPSGQAKEIEPTMRLYSEDQVRSAVTADDVIRAIRSAFARGFATLRMPV